MKIETINVSLKKDLELFSYPIFVGNNLLTRGDNLLKKYIKNKKIIIIHDCFFSSKLVLDETFKEFVKSIKEITLSVNLIAISGGDQTKNMIELTNIIEKTLLYEIDRECLIIAFGGGVIGDIAGFAASILLRGIKFINVPTTLLSQVDSSVGGKTGVNSKLGKNLIGSFHQPVAVIADINILKSLPDREFRAGFAEVIKYGLIKDKSFFNWLELEFENIFKYDDLQLQKVITKCCQIKADIIQDDEKEYGNRALLNLGHTFAHAIESFGNYDGKIIHGEAVAVGICMAFKFSSKYGFCSRSDTERVINIFKKSKLPTSLRDIPDLSITTLTMVEKFKYDKKTRNNKLTFILNHQIGEAFIKHDVNVNELIEFINEEI
ncbi:3-dehydroquinate synthase [Alphaproteobacteria bacterium]|nr:3-dehydroquinate synthase [Alphaproteobacteria bacterium]